MYDGSKGHLELFNGTKYPIVGQMNSDPVDIKFKNKHPIITISLDSRRLETYQLNTINMDKVWQSQNKQTAYKVLETYIYVTVI